MCKDVYKYGVNAREFNEQHWEFVKSLGRKELMEMGRKGESGHYGLYKCNHCETEVVRQKCNFNSSLFICPNECNGVRHGGAGRITIKGVNDLATTHPHLVKYLKNRRDAYKYSANSRQKVKLRCLDCGNTKEVMLFQLTRQGYGCSVCSEGVSYSEKFVASLLMQLKVAFKKEFSFDNRKTRYDFYLPQHNCIIEVHGIQHYEESNRGRSLEEEQINDRYKKGLALDRGIKHYVVLDARESSFTYLKRNVLNSSLPNLLNFNEETINWKTIGNNCEKSIVKRVCNHYNMYRKPIRKIGEKYGLSSSTVVNYLVRGTELGWCNYKDKDKAKGNKPLVVRGKKVKGVNLETRKAVKFNSGLEAGEWVIQQGLSSSSQARSNISKCCSGKQKSAYGYVWSYID